MEGPWELRKTADYSNDAGQSPTRRMGMKNGAEAPFLRFHSVATRERVNPDNAKDRPNW
jgi:hypothetical protein